MNRHFQAACFLACAALAPFAGTAAAGESGPTTVITGQPGVNTAIAAGTQGNEIVAVVGQTVSCALPEPPPASIPSCDVSRITRPNIMEPNGPNLIPACDQLSDRDYQELVFLNLQVYQLMARHAAQIAARLTCMLGVQVSAGHVLAALADLSGMLCQTGPAANRPFIVSCSNDNNSSAYYQGGLPYSTSHYDGFSGTLNFRPERIAALKAREQANSGSTSLLRARRFARTDFEDTLVHENTHALVSYFESKYASSGANAEGRFSACSVGPLTRTYSQFCGPSWATVASPFQYQVGTNYFDTQTYRPYMASNYVAEQIPRLQRWIRQHRAAMAPLLRKREHGKVLTDSQRMRLEEWDAYNQNLARIRAQIPCATNFDNAGGNAILQNWDDPHASINPGCNVRPSGRFRDEANARAIARDIVGGSCQQSDAYFFNSYGGLREP